MLPIKTHLLLVPKFRLKHVPSVKSEQDLSTSVHLLDPPVVVFWHFLRAFDGVIFVQIFSSKSLLFVGAYSFHSLNQGLHWLSMKKQYCSSVLNWSQSSDFLISKFEVQKSESDNID